MFVKPKLFFCYSRRLKRALVANGFIPICTGINERTNNKFWLFGAKKFNFTRTTFIKLNVIITDFKENSQIG
nr:MAG TPA: hypothetical protein [Caudoviricetes sp.]